jgi:hypothetical protein
VRGSFVLSSASVALSITPHMHLLGKDMKVTATLPGGKLVPLVYVKDWDFNWQELYSFRDGIDLPPGTRLDLVAHYDNSEDNPRNPNRPPKAVRWGEETSDEMYIAFIELVSREPAANESDLKLPERSAMIRFLVAGQAAAATKEDAADPLKRLTERLFRTSGNKPTDK